MDPIRERELVLTRRQLLGRSSRGIGVMALASLLNPELFAQEVSHARSTSGPSWSSAFRPNGQACHLSPSIGCSFTNRSLRLQTEVDGFSGIRTAGYHP
jgi:hypothetical protein